MFLSGTALLALLTLAIKAGFSGFALLRRGFNKADLSGFQFIGPPLAKTKKQSRCRRCLCQSGSCFVGGGCKWGIADMPIYHNFFRDSKVLIWVSGARGFHPYALQEPYVTVSRHTAPTVQPMAESQIPKTLLVRVHGAQCDPTSGSP